MTKPARTQHAILVGCTTAVIKDKVGSTTRISQSRTRMRWKHELRSVIESNASSRREITTEIDVAGCVSRNIDTRCDRSILSISCRTKATAVNTTSEHTNKNTALWLASFFCWQAPRGIDSGETAFASFSGSIQSEAPEG